MPQILYWQCERELERPTFASDGLLWPKAITMEAPELDLEGVMRELYASEINFAIEAFWDRGITVRLGDALNGVEEEHTFRLEELHLAARWLAAAACEIGSRPPRAANFADTSSEAGRAEVRT